MTRSVPLVLLILASAFLFTTCAAPRMMSLCTPDTNSRAPVVCVDDTDLANLTVDRPQAHVYTGATAQFWTNSKSGDLWILSNTLPADSINCIPGQGHCIVKIKGGLTEDQKHYKYLAVVMKNDQTGATKDPTIIIDTQ